MRAPRRSAAPMTEPITMPAICPPESPSLAVVVAPSAVLVTTGTPVDEADEDGEDVVVGKSGVIEVYVGRRTFAHRVFTSDVTQHESVELTVLKLQYVHRPFRFDRNPQSSGSFT